MEWVEGSEVARGATAIVTRGAFGRVVKTIDKRVPPIAARLEAAGTAAAYRAGLPSPALHGVDEGPPARLFMDFVDGVPLGELVPTLGPAFIGEELARCQALVRGARVSPETGVMSVASLLEYQIDAGPLPSAVKTQLRSELRELPAGSAFCHMDLHPLNILWDGERSTIIDWMNARLGPAAADVARTRVILQSLPHYVGTDPETLRVVATLTAAFEATTRHAASHLWDESHAWLRVLRAARLDENPPSGERAALLSALDITGD